MSECEADTWKRLVKNNSPNISTNKSINYLNFTSKINYEKQES